MPQRFKSPAFDKSPVPTIKCYPYVLTGWSKDRGFAAPQAHSKIAISQAPFKTKPNLLLRDENNNLYLEIISASNSKQDFHQVSMTSYASNALNSSNNITFITKQYPSNFKKLFIFTIGEPFNKTKANNDEQKIFIVGDETPIIDIEQTEINANPKAENYYEINAYNIATIFHEYTNCDYEFYINDTGKLDNLTFMLNGKEVSGLQVEVNNGALVNRINVVATLEGTDQPVRLKSDNKLVPIKAHPIDLHGDTLTMFMDWFDYTNVIPFKNIAHNSTQIIEKYLVDLDPKQNNPGDPYYEAGGLLHDMIAITYLFNSNFKDVIKPKSNSNIVQQVDPTKTIGWCKWNIAQFQNSTAQQVCDKRFDLFMANVIGANISKKAIKVLKATILALSQYIESSYTMAGGSNDIDEVMLPWYLKADKNITLKADGSNNFILEPSISFSPKTKWLDSPTALPSSTDISSVKCFYDLEQVMTIPSLPPVLVPIDKTTLPSQMLKTNSDLKYMFYMPAKDSDIATLYGQVKSTDIHADKTFNTDATQWGHMLSIGNRKEYILNQAIKQGIITSSTMATIKNFGTLQTNESKDYEKKEGSPLESIKINHNKADMKNYLAEKYRYDTDAIILNNGSFYRYGISYQTHYGPVMDTHIDIKYKLKQQYLDGVVITIDGKMPDLVENKILYNKSEWVSFLTRYDIGDKRSHTYNLVPWDKKGKISNIQEIIISGVWISKIRLSLTSNEGSYNFDIDTFNKADESIATRRIIFT